MIWVFGKSEYFLCRGWTLILLDAYLICPSGCFLIPPSSPRRKNISFRRSVETALLIRHPASQEGRIAIVTDAGRDAVDVDGASDESA